MHSSFVLTHAAYALSFCFFFYVTFLCQAAYTLKRFLIARKYDVENASQMLMTYIGWRVSHFPENQIKSEEIQRSLEADKVQILKHPDKQGHICIVVRLADFCDNPQKEFANSKSLTYVPTKTYCFFFSCRLW